MVKEWQVLLFENGEWIEVSGIVTHAESSALLDEYIGRRGLRAKAVYLGNGNDRPAGLATKLRKV